MLYLVATPIGNLQDITLRAISCLQSVDYILCEDTRHSSKLLHAHSISTPLVSFHLFNENEKEERVLQDLRDGKQVALISDAGTPLISDPGFHLVRTCWEQKITVTTIPGPCALICALTTSGLPTTTFQFIGFLPKKELELKECLHTILDYKGTTIAYESPHRLHKTIATLSAIDPDQKISICRELTKQYETISYGRAEELLPSCKDVKGEIVLLFEQSRCNKSTSFSPKLLHMLVEDLITQGQSRKDAIHTVSNLLHIPKNEVYQAAHLALDL